VEFTPKSTQVGTAAGTPASRRTIGQYEVIAKLGEGGMGEVYRARDPKLGRDVALKILPVALAHDSQSMARLEREARALAALNNPNIAAIYGLEESDGLRALVMELVEGETLAERIHGTAGTAAKPMPAEEALPIAKQIAEALEYAHERGVIHRDLKPANVKITPEGVVKVLDFGLAKVLSDQDSMAPVSANSPTLSAMATQAGIILGTAAYMAPEQAKGKPVDKRADIWAFGCVLYEMLAGRKPFDGETISDLLAAVIRAEPDWTALPGTTPASIQKLIHRCLVKDPKQRLRDIGDARIAIEETLSGGADAGGADAAVSGGTIAEARRASRLRRAMPWALGASTVLLAAIAAYFVFQPKPRQNVVRFTITPPENTQFVYGGEMGISPDGRDVAFIAQAGPDKPWVLWVRPLDSLTAVPIQGTEGASAPFWSPDSQQIGFYAGGKLEKVALAGGPPQTLCDANNTAGGDWSRDGVILFTNQGAIYRVPETGGAPTLVAAPDAARHESAYRSPIFLPDGRHFLFDSSTGNFGQRFIAVGSLDSKSVERVAQASSNAAYAPPGYLFYMDRSTLMARPFDAKALRFTGPPVPLAENVDRSAGGYGYFAVSPAGVLAYTTESGVAPSQMTWFNRQGQKLGTLGQPNIYSAPALSPDGSRLAVALGEPGKRDNWVFDLKRGTASRLNFNPADDGAPAWSADGTRIFFSSNRSGDWDIYQKAADGLGATQPVFQSRGETKVLNDLSADGRYAIYTMPTGATTSEQWVLPLFGDRKPFAFVQGNFNAFGARVSPNGRYLAYTSTETGRAEVYVQTFPQHTGKWQISVSGGTEPTWRRDGKELFYLSPENKVMAVAVSTDSTSFQGGIPKELFQAQLVPSGIKNAYVVSPDGQRFLMLVPAGEAMPEPMTVVVNWPALLGSSGGRY
jgi:eukaryotic-like serine/threonine-protein kinase